LSTPEELLELIEPYLDDLALTPELGELERPMRYALAGGGKRVRPMLCLATAEAAGAEPEAALPAAAAVELVHNFSLVHDDLPGMDNDEVRRGRPSTWAEFGQGIGILAGDALLAEALRLALTYPTPNVARELVQATLGMIGGQYLDITGAETDLASLHHLKTGRLFAAPVACALWVAEVPEREQAPWRAFADEVGLLFQIVDDILDEDGYLLEHGPEGARALADQAADRAQAYLLELPADTSVLAGIVSGLAARTS
jgi:geranylgeranyl diphosphate synthase, type II